jgi:hypothetical protein
VAWTGIVLTAAVVLTIGLPLVGGGVFHASDLLLGHAPWAASAPPGFRPTNPLLGDTVNNELPQHAAFRRRVRSGDFPAWLALPSGGRPLGTVPDAGSFGLLTLPYLVVPLWYAPALAKLLEMAAAGGFTFLFLRRVGLGRAPALVGGLIYLGSGFQVVWTNWPQPRVGAWIPALFWALERGLQRRDLRGFLPLPLVTAMLIFEGFPSVAGYALLAAAGYAAVRVLAGTGLIRSRVHSLILPGAAVVLGIGLAALQLLPLAQRLGQLDLTYRLQTPDSHLPLTTAMTLAVPNAFGSPVDGNYFGPLNYVEIQSFVGGGALVLVAVAAVRGRRVATARGIQGFLWGGSAIAGILLWVGGPALAAFQLVWLFRMNPVGRVRSVLGFFLACLAAVGLESLRRRQPERAPIRRSVVIPLSIGGAAIAAAAAWRVAQVAGDAGQLDYVLARSVVPVGAAAVVIAVVILGRRARRSGHSLALWVVPGVIALESITFARGFLPRVPRDDFYPWTAAHEFLHDRLGPDRFASAGLAMSPGTSTYYGLRALTANTFYPPTWAEAIERVDADSFAGSPLFPVLDASPAVATSPVLDRLSVRYFAVAPEAGVFGSVVGPGPASPTPVELPPGGSVVGELPPGKPRAVVLRVAGPTMVSSPASVSVTLEDQAGTVVASGSRRIVGSVPAQLTIPVPEPERGSGPVRVRVHLEGGDQLTLEGTAGGGARLSAVEAAGDGLRLAFTDGVLLYERLAALPRIRWAGTAEVITDPQRRLATMDETADPAAVLLSQPGPPAAGTDASVRILRDQGDDISVGVDAAGAGYLVVADALQDGWRAAVDGEQVPLRDAEHAGVAVYVKSGSHRVTLRYEPSGWDLGRAISAVALLIYLAALFVLSPWRRSPPAAPEETPAP